jgi:hypothetical protein
VVQCRVLCDSYRKREAQQCSTNHTAALSWPAEHPGSAAKAALNDCPHERKAKGAHLAAFVSCNPLFPLIRDIFDDLERCLTPYACFLLLNRLE